MHDRPSRNALPGTKEVCFALSHAPLRMRTLGQRRLGSSDRGCRVSLSWGSIMSKRSRKVVSQEFIDDSDDPEDTGVSGCGVDRRAFIGDSYA